MTWINGSEGGEAEGRGRRGVEVAAGPDRRIKHSLGLARVALKALAHRLRPEDSPPEKQLFRGNSGLSNVDTMA